MNVGDKDDDLQKEVHTASKIYKNVLKILLSKSWIMNLFSLVSFVKKTHKTTFIV